MEIYGTAPGVPTSATINEPPAGDARPAHVYYTCAPWGLYLNGKGYVNGTEITGSKEFDAGSTSSSTSVATLDNAYVTSARYVTDTFECGGTFTLPSGGAIISSKEAMKITLTVADAKKNLRVIKTNNQYDTYTPAANTAVKIENTKLTTGAALEYEIDRGLLFSNATLSYSTSNSALSNKLVLTRNWLLTVTKDSTSCTRVETGGTLSYPQSGYVVFTLGNGTLKVGTTTYNSGTVITANASGNKLTYTITGGSNGGSITNVRYYSYAEFNPPTGTISSYESGGILAHPSTSNGTFAINLAGANSSRQISFTSGVNGTKAFAPTAAKPTVTITGTNLTGTSLAYTLANGLTYSSSSLVYPISTTVKSNELTYTKQWSATLSHKGSTSTPSTKETGGVLSFPEKGTIELTTNSSGTKTLTFASGTSLTTKNVSGTVTTTIQPSQLLGTTSPYSVAYTVADDLTTKSIKYSYNANSAPFTVKLGKPDTNSCSNKVMTSTLTKTVTDPTVKAMIAETDALTTSLSMGEAALASQKSQLQTTNTSLISTNTSLKSTNTSLISTNSGLKKTNAEKSDEKTQLEDDIRIAEKNIADRKTKLAAVGSSTGLSADFLTPAFKKAVYNLKVQNKISDSKTPTEFDILPVQSDTNNYSMTIYEPNPNTKTLTYVLTKTIKDPVVVELAEEKAAALAAVGTEQTAQIEERAQKLRENADLQAEIDRLTANNEFMQKQIQTTLPEEKSTLQREIEALTREIGDKNSGLQAENERLTDKRESLILENQKLNEQVATLTQEKADLPKNKEILQNKIKAVEKLLGISDLALPKIKRFVHNLTVTHTKTHNIACTDAQYGEEILCEGFSYVKNSMHEIIKLRIETEKTTKAISGGAMIDEMISDPYEKYIYDGRYFNLYSSAGQSPCQELFTVGEQLTNANVTVSFSCEGKAITTGPAVSPITYVPKFKLDEEEEHEEGGTQSFSLKDHAVRFKLQYTTGLSNKQLKITGTVDNVPVTATVSEPPYETDVYFMAEPFGLYSDKEGSVRIVDNEFLTSKTDGKSYYDGFNFTYTGKITTSSPLSLALDNAVISDTWYVREYENGGTLRLPQKGDITIETDGYGMVEFTLGVVEGTPAHDLSKSSTVTITKNQLDDSLSLTYVFKHDDQNMSTYAKTARVSIVYDVITQNPELSADTSRTIADSIAKSESYTEAK